MYRSNLLHTCCRGDIIKKVFWIVTNLISGRKTETLKEVSTIKLQMQNESSISSYVNDYFHDSIVSLLENRNSIDETVTTVKSVTTKHKATNSFGFILSLRMR